MWFIVLWGGVWGLGFVFVWRVWEEVGSVGHLSYIWGMSKSLRGSFRIDPEKFKLAQKHFGKEKPQDVIDAFFDGLWLSYYPPKPIAKMEVYARATETAQNLRRGENKEKVEKESKAQISQPNHSTDTVLGKPVKLPEESGIDYSIRLAAWKEQNQLK